VVPVVATPRRGGDDEEDGGVARHDLLQSAENVKQFVREVVKASATDLFFKLCMSDSVTPSVWRDSIRQYAEAARKAASLSPTLKVVVFLDESNTCRNMCMTAEVMTCNTLDGEPLPSNLFFVGAVNPLSNVDADAASRNQFTGVSDVLDSQDYVVYASPPTMQRLHRSVGDFGDDERDTFTRAYFRDSNLGVAASLRHYFQQQCSNATLEDDFFRMASRCINAAHTFVERARMHRVKPSIRDVVRCLRLFDFFLTQPYSDVFTHAMSPLYTTGADDGSGVTLSTSSESFVDVVKRQFDKMQKRLRTGVKVGTSLTLMSAWKALVLSIALVYYLRLDSRYDRGGGAAPEDLRAAFIAAFDRSVRAPPAMQDVVRQYPLAHVLSEQSRAFYALCVVPPGIAPTRALVENVWAVAVCVQACVGVLLTGPAGCGKTLAMQIVLSNLRGLGSEQEAFTNLKSIRTFAYQCR
jgi:hypothetical protein